MNRLKKGDDVIVLAGKDKGKRGKILRMLGERQVVIEGVNLVKRHTRPNPQKGGAGGIIEKENPIDRSNIALYNAATKMGDRVGFRILDDGRKVRFFKKTGEMIDA
jgi:large subunit ribosomal protein L24